MHKISNEAIEQLLMQVRFAPVKKRRKQVDSAEKLLDVIDEDREYPFEFICYRITGHRPKEPEKYSAIKGDELAEDIRIFIEKLSGQVAEAIDREGQKVYTLDELAAAFNVSTKTIARWRERGLVARKFLFSDGVKRFAFLQSSVDDFAEKNPLLVAKAKAFVRMTAKDRKHIIDRAAELAEKTRLSRHQIIKKIADEIDKVHETVRYTILNYEKENPDKPVFKKPAGVISPAQEAEIYKLLKQGYDTKELMKRFGRSKSSIYRIINQRRARLLLAKKIEFIDSEEFVKPNANEKIFSEPFAESRARQGNVEEPVGLSGDSLEKYLMVLKSAPVLKREQEMTLFRRYNYLKYLAFATRTEMKASGIKSGLLTKIENCLAEAERIKKMIIESNLRLVVSIAGKHTIGGANLLDLISDGNMSLMRAVEKFDYTRGVRFATYASWAISKDFARKIPQESARPDKAPTASLANIQRDLRITKAADFAVVERARKNLIQVVTDDLNQREQYIILNHFGLLGTTVKKERKTLKGIGDHLGLTKERVRQIELIALQKLRQSLSLKEFELLTGK